ncbi:hypothetical protein [Paenibacillus sp. OAS669]|uniref:hypothetical protein n=1 Tax=Paenibacillus sp. OAS669 TaxID=2663821 RepID=UPI00178920BA|nr:hypothetical protein [Paenibacillus sp. OAS669]MBE1442732.1 hypothetical protein [Paenibacillus sp. OAS669]
MKKDYTNKQKYVNSYLITSNNNTTREIGAFVVAVSRILLYILEYGATGLFTFSIFRLLFGRNLYKILSITTIMSLLSYYLSEVAAMKGITIFFLPTFLIISCTVLFNLPIAYSFLISIIYTIVGFLAEYLIASIAQLIGLTTYMGISNSLTQMSIIQISTSILLLLLTALFNYRKFGFMFLARQLYGRKALKPLNVIFGVLLILIVCAIQASRLSMYTATHSMIHPIIFFLIALLLIIVLIIAWRRNKNAVDKKYLNTTGVGKK